ncbi:hypothetical protein DUNSADRAFT_17284 [Dunaliella salina]|uniref:Uncharacterized protein n=1 Tax=Dunaliella salina TaxID=3046 RepID=A0ABQ7G219_DUNSA|nr:hypothetical protein DUNSADRAFT_17284 [Dunaliella salina]|eukprot:KAF5828646.1 hypothetical protein DUNSADRAFT_17284 [Dunaliella salina]
MPHRLPHCRYLRKAPLAMTLENADGKIPIELANSHESLLALLPFPLKWLRAVKKKAVKKANYACSSLDKDVHAAAQHANRVLRHAWFWSCSNKGTEAIQSSAASRHRSHTEQCFSSEHGFTDTAGKQVLCELLSTYDVADPGSDFYFPPEDKNEEGDTALMLACKGGSDELVEMLLDAFPDQDLDVKDAKGRAVWHLVPMSRPSVIGLLQKADERQRRLLGEEGL